MNVLPLLLLDNYKRSSSGELDILLLLENYEPSFGELRTFFLFFWKTKNLLLELQTFFSFWRTTNLLLLLENYKPPSDLCLCAGGDTGGPSAGRLHPLRKHL